jgi:hypothetical protein
MRDVHKYINNYLKLPGDDFGDVGERLTFELQSHMWN